MLVIGLLDDEPLEGTFGVRRWLTAQRAALLVNAEDLGDALNAVEQACNVWGGGCHLLVPVDPNGSDFAEPWRTLIEDTSPVRTAVRGLRDKSLALGRTGLGGAWTDEIGGNLTLSALARLERSERGYRTVRTANGLDASNPWTIAYAAVWGRLPEHLDTHRLEMERLNPGSKYSDLVQIDDSKPVAPGAADLLASLRDPRLATAAHLSWVGLGLTSAPTDQNLMRNLEPALPVRFHRARVYGPNLVVVYEPGSVADLCLLWYLRSVHGMPPGLPLGVPITDDVGAVLALWTSQMAMRYWSFHGGRGHLVSASVDMDRLERIASQTGSGWEAVPLEAVLQPTDGCGIRSSEVAVFKAGSATVGGVHPAELSALGRDVLTDIHHTLELVVTPIGQDLPPSRFLGSPVPFTAYRGGAVLPGVGSEHGTVNVDWLTGWTVLDALLRDRGFRGEPSAPGRLAETLLRRCTELGGFVSLLHDDGLRVLEDLAARHGMNWFKQKLRSVLDLGDDPPAGVSERIAVVEDKVNKLASLPSEEELTSMSFEGIRQRMGDARTTHAWLSWADQAGLVLRGANVKCDYCSGRSWRPMTELAPPINCRGCGRVVDRPYDYRGIQFRYRATEFLMRLVKDDAIVHALALRYLLDLYRSRSGGIPLIFGGYPGVTVRREGESQVFGEADVLVVMSDGRFGVGECKSRAAGLLDEEVNKLGRLADALGASWTFTATLDRSAVCGPLWRTSPTNGRIPHFALTAEHLYDAAPTSVLGAPHPLEWRETFLSFGGRDSLSDDDQRKAFRGNTQAWEEWRQKRDLPWWRQES